MMIRDAVEVSAQHDFSPFISEVLDYIDSHVSETMSLKTLAGHFYMSTYHLTHRFKEETGYTVNQYILRRKLGKAQESLVFGNEPIKKLPRIAVTLICSISIHFLKSTREIPLRK